MTAGYSGTPLPKKLGIKEGSVVALVAAPDDFDQTLAPLPDAVELRNAARGKRDLTIWFTTARRDLEKRFGSVSRGVDSGLWIAWPKGSSDIDTDLNENIVRDIGLARGFVDHKVCAIDEDWSGLRFARRS
jgi:hypothetical protein